MLQTPGVRLASRQTTWLAVALLCLTLVPATVARAKMKRYADVVPASATTDEGLFTTHRVDDRLLFEVPDNVLGRDMIVMSRIASAQDGLADGGAMMAPNIVVRWERRDNRLLLRALSYRAAEAQFGMQNLRTADALERIAKAIGS